MPKRPSTAVLVLLAVWAILVLAHPAWLLGALVASATFPAFLETIPYVILLGLLRLPVALIALALWAVAIGAGGAMLRRAGLDTLTEGERAVFGGALGMGILSIGTFLLARLSGGATWLLTALVAGLVLAMAVLGFREIRQTLAAGRMWFREWRGRRRASSIFIIVLSAGIVAFALTRANVPVVGDYDSLEYHLAAPAQWWRAGGVFFIRDVVYTNMPQNVEMQYLAAMCLCGGPSLGATVGLQVGVGFVVLTSAAVALCGKRLAGEAAGLAAAAIVLTMPMLAELATLNCYVVELPLTAYSFLALYAFLLLRRGEGGRQRWRLAALCGAMAGLAIGCKYPAILFVLAPVLAFIVAGGIVRPRWLRRSLAEGYVVGMVAVAVASPWLIRNTVNTGNPTYPLLYHTFGGENWSPEQDVKFAKAHGPSDVRLLGMWRPFFAYGFWRDQPGEAGKAPWRPPMSPVLFLFALVPIALADRRSAVPILLFAIVAFALAAKERFWPGEWRGDVLLAAAALALITCPAFLLPRRDLVYFGVYFVVCLVAWYTLTHRLDRFLDPASPAVAVLAGVGLTAVGNGWPGRIARGVLVGGLAFALATTAIVHAPITAAGLAQPREEFLQLVTERSSYCQPAIEAINTDLPPDAVVLFVGESRTFYCRRRVLAATVFDRHPLDRIIGEFQASRVPAEPVAAGDRLLAAARAPEPADRGAGDVHQAIHDGLRAMGVTHVYVNWPEARRLSNTYAYRFGGEQRPGFSEHITPELFSELVARGHLRAVATFGSGAPPPFALYEVR